MKILHPRIINAYLPLNKTFFWSFSSLRCYFCDKHLKNYPRKFFNEVSLTINFVII